MDRWKKTLAEQLTEQLTITGNRQADWDLHIPMVLWAYRSAVQESTGCTPAALMFGHELRTPVDLAFGPPPVEGAPGLSYYYRLRDQLRKAVWVYSPQRKRGMCPKLSSKWIGPCVVLDKLSDVVYRVQLTGRKRTVVLHCDRLAPYRPLARPQWGNRDCGGIVHWDCNISACNEDAIEPLRAYPQASCSSLGLCNAGWGL